MSALNNSSVLLLPTDAVTTATAKSLRFNSANSTYLSRTPASAGNRKTWTLSFWFKVTTIAGQGIVGNLKSGGINGFSIEAGSSGPISFYDYSSNLVWQLTPTRVFRDTSAWYHFVLAVDTTQSTASNRVKLYVNGIQETVFTTESYPSQNYDTLFNTAEATAIGAFGTYGSGIFNGYLANVYFIDGQALTPSSFGETDTNGIWQHKAYGGSYGTNGFYLSFQDNSATTATTLGKDGSGNNNNWTPNNFELKTVSPVSVSSATGAFPIFNTTDTYGRVKGSGLRSDGNASSLSLCVPMGASGALSITDEQPTGRTSGSLTLTNTSVSIGYGYKFYDGSAYFPLGASLRNASPGSQVTLGTGDFTFEGWYYLLTGNTYPTALEIGNHLGSTGILFIVGNGGTVNIYSGGFYGGAPIKTRQWNHIAWVRSSGVLKIYVNGVLGSTTNFTNNLTDTTGGISIGYNHSVVSASYQFEGFMQDVRLYKGVAKYTADFSVSLNPENTSQVNRVHCSLTDFISSSGTDTGLGSEVQGNYCVFNPNNAGTSLTVSNGGLQVNQGVNSSSHAVISTTAITSGKFYMEFVCDGKGYGSNNGGIGWGLARPSHPTYAGGSVSIGAYGIGVNGNDGNLIYDGSTVVTDYIANGVNGYTISPGDIMMLAFDGTTGKVWMGKNGVWGGSATASDVANGLNAGYTVTPGTWMPGLDMGTDSGATQLTANFGQRQFAFAAPTGFKALCTSNLTTPSITNGRLYVDALTYTGNGSTQTISGLNFSSDLVWVKRRDTSGQDHVLQDSVRGFTSTTKLSSSSSSKENAGSGTATSPQWGYITGTSSTGFSITADTSGDQVNVNGGSYAAWCWDSASSDSSNGTGTITSTVRANNTSGFSIVTYTGNGSGGATVGHGLTTAPSIVIIKCRNNNYDWHVYSRSLDPNGRYQVYLNSTAGSTDFGAPSFFSANSSVITLTSNSVGINGSTLPYVAYCFAPVSDFSAFGSYTGTGSASAGPFITTGFKPELILIKCTTAATNWQLKDDARVGYNGQNNVLWPNVTSGEYTTQSDIAVDHLADGFKIRTADAGYNTVNGNYIYLAFAQNPFQNARAR